MLVAERKEKKPLAAIVVATEQRARAKMVALVSIQKRKLLRYVLQSTSGAANEAERANVLTYRDLCAFNQVSIVPMGRDVYGPPGRPRKICLARHPK